MDQQIAPGVIPQSTPQPAITSPPTSTKEGFFRRNGKPQSCEPCRKSKVRCDHNFPVCLRCRARNAGAQCVYHPAPLTRPKGTYRTSRIDGESGLSNGLTLPSLSSTIDFERASGGVANGASPESHLGTLRSNERSGTGHQLALDGKSDYEKVGMGYGDESLRGSNMSPNTDGSNFLGSTSYSSVFTNKWRSPLSRMDPHNSEDTPFDEEIVNKGARFLELLSRIPDVESHIKQFYQVRHFVFIPELLVLNSLFSIKATLQGQANAFSHLQNLSRAIFLNTANELDFSHLKTPRVLHEMITGPNLRWEIIGIIFTLVALSAQAVSKDTAPNKKLHRDFVRDMAATSEDILSICNSQNQVNDLVAWYQYESLLLQASIHGDTSAFTWRRLGDLATTIYSIGMHQTMPRQYYEKSSETSVFFQESRKKCYSASYTLDKAIATLFGRPPRISIQYSTQKIPLNLSDEETMAEGEQMIANLSKLDVDGWNRDGLIRCCSWIRTRTLVAQIREEVLLLSLSKNVTDVESRAVDALTRSQIMWASIPPLMKYSTDSWSTRPTAKETYMLLIVYLDHTYSSFLLHRLLAKHLHSDSRELYDTAWVLLTSTLTLIRERSRLQGIQNQLSHTIIYHGIPSAGLLALELLRKSQAAGAYQSLLLIPRAELIRSLSVFIDSLDWIARPNGGNYALCLSAKKVLNQIIDAVLDPQSYQHSPITNGAYESSIGGGADERPGLSTKAGSPSDDSAVSLTSNGHKESWDSSVMVSGAGGIEDWEAKLMSMETGMDSAGTIDWDAWISTQ